MIKRPWNVIYLYCPWYNVTYSLRTDYIAHRFFVGHIVMWPIFLMDWFNIALNRINWNNLWMLLAASSVFAGTPSNPGERAKMPFTLSYKSQIVTHLYESLFNLFFCALPPFSILLPHSFVPCLRDRVVRGSVVVVVRVVTVVVIVLCCCCFFLLLLLRGNLSFFFCCCCLFVVVSACSPYWLCFSWCSLRLSSPLLAFSACVHCVFLGVLRKWGIRIINPYGLYGLLIRMDHTDS